MKRYGAKRFISLLMMGVVLFSTNAVHANAAELESNDLNEAVQQGDVQEGVVLYKEGNEYKAKLENGEVVVWGYDEKISTERGVQSIAPYSRTATGWKYYKTDKYATHLNYKVLGGILNGADAVTQLSVALGVSIAVAGFIVSYRPTAVYHVDVTYTYTQDPLYWKCNMTVYKNSNYTGKIDSYTKYYNWRN